ncbi:MAG: CDP-alcohol phosphatidyltransferase family protein [Oscillospiraceae bacterium]|nr:CDP-alcohol phosphatidyltransferase family protein [Oscillospiraceae bacterium]
MKLWNIELKMTVPNAMSLFRVALVPVFAVLYLKGYLWPSLAVLVLSGLTDLFDGMVARRFHQISDLGKLLDPIADKLTQVTVVICVAVKIPALIPLVVLLFCKELGQAVGGLLLLRRGEKMQGARWWGKVATFVFYVVMGVLMLFSESLAPWLRTALSLLVGAWLLFAFVRYLVLFFKLERQAPSTEKTSPEQASPKDISAQPVSDQPKKEGTL